MEHRTANGEHKANHSNINQLIQVTHQRTVKDIDQPRLSAQWFRVESNWKNIFQQLKLCGPSVLHTRRVRTGGIRKWTTEQRKANITPCAAQVFSTLGESTHAPPSGTTPAGWSSLEQQAQAPIRKKLCENVGPTAGVDTLRSFGWLSRSEHSTNTEKENIPSPNTCLLCQPPLHCHGRPSLIKLVQPSPITYKAVCLPRGGVPSPFL